MSGNTVRFRAVLRTRRIEEGYEPAGFDSVSGEAAETIRATSLRGPWRKASEVLVALELP